jgi:hypothetical protein
MDDATGLAEALLGLDGFAVLAVEETPSEVIVTVETTADFVPNDARQGCPRSLPGLGATTRRIQASMGRGILLRGFMVVAWTMSSCSGLWSHWKQPAWNW